jgi:putative membrane protein
MKKIFMMLMFVWTMLFAGQAIAQTLSRNETIYVTLNNQGSPEMTKVVTWLHTDSKSSSIDMADLSGVKNVKGRENPTISNGSITFTEPCRDIFYSGTTSKALPIAIDIRYKLAGKPVKPEKLAGRSGRMQMRIHVRNLTVQPREIEYIEVGTGVRKRVREDLSVPFMVQASMDLDISMFSNVRAPDGAFAVVGNIMKMNWLAFPYPEATITLEADVEDFKMPSILFTAIPKFPPLPEIELESELNRIYQGVDKMGTYLVKLENGAHELNDGQKAMLLALEQLNDGTGRLIMASNAQNEIIDGAVKINEGIGAKITPLTKIPFVSGGAGKAMHYLDVQRALLELAADGGTFSDDISNFMREQGKDAPTVKEFPGIRVTTEGLTKLNQGSTEMIAGARKLEKGSAEMAGYLERLRQEGTDTIKQGITSGADPLLRKLAAVKTAKEMARCYDRFSGRPSGMKSSVEFIMKTPEE